MNELSELKERWHEVSHSHAFVVGKGENLHLYIRTRFDGFGNAITRFVVKDHDQEISYEKYDAAVYNYNRLANK